MNPTQTETVRRLAWEGPFEFSTTVGIGVLVLAVLAWSLWRERSILGTQTTLAFGTLRMLAVLVVLWMVCAPNRVTVETSSTRQAIAVLTDVSGSMRTIDSPGTADDIRWLPGSEINLATELADRSVVAVGVALNELQRAEDAVRNHRGDVEVNQHRVAAGRAIDRIDTHLNAMPSSVSTDPIGSTLRKARQVLNSGDLESFRQRCRLLAKGKATQDADLQDRLSDLRYRVIGFRNVLTTLSNQCAAHESRRLDETGSAARGKLSKHDRLWRVNEAVNRWRDDSLQRINDDVDIHYARFDQTTRSVLPNEDMLQQADDLPATDVTAALQYLRDLQQTQPVAAAFMLSDLAHNELQSDQTTRKAPASFAGDLTDLPVFPVPIGNPNHRRDVALVATEAPPIAMRNDNILIQAQLHAHQCRGDTCVVQLISDSRIVDFRDVTIDSDFVTRKIRFDHRVSDVGQQSFQIAITPLDGEATTDNNFGTVDINVTRSDIKVLLADELPRWEFRYLAQLFRRDPKVDHDELLFRPRRIATGRRESTQQFPIDDGQWDHYDVVILGDVSPGRLSDQSQASLVQYVRRRGGTVVLVAGHQAMPQSFEGSPLQAFVPVKPTLAPIMVDDYAFRITEAGRSHVALMVGENRQATRDAWNFVNQFSPLHDVSRWRTPLRTATSLIDVVPRAVDDSGGGSDSNETPAETFLCWQPFGRGRVVYLSGPDTYRLRFLRGDQIHYRFWGQLMRWAIASDLSTGSQQVRIRTAKSRYETGETIRVEAELFDEDGSPMQSPSKVALKLESSSQQINASMKPLKDRPTTYTVDFENLPAGVYRAYPVKDALTARRDQGDIDDNDGITFTVAADVPTEMIDTRRNNALASQLAAATGGQVLSPSSIDEVLALTDLSPRVTSTMTTVPIWAQWQYLLLVFGCLQTEWIVRKWRGLS
ncbi:MAG: hypothetical protein AAF539_03695 [Planctomycetota bacterium]